MLLVGLQCHWLISLYRDLQKYPCFCSFEWCTLRFFFFFLFFKVTTSLLPQAPLNQFLSRRSILCTLYTHFWVFIPTRGFFSLYSSLGLAYNLHLCWDVLRLVSFASTCYSLYPLLVFATGYTHCWYVLRVVPIAGTCYRLYLLLGYAYNLHPLLGCATTYIHCWDVLQVVPIAGTCYKL